MAAGKPTYIRVKKSSKWMSKTISYHLHQALVYATYDFIATSFELSLSNSVFQISLSLLSASMSSRTDDAHMPHGEHAHWHRRTESQPHRLRLMRLVTREVRGVSAQYRVLSNNNVLLLLIVTGYLVLLRELDAHMYDDLIVPALKSTEYP